MNKKRGFTLVELLAVLVVLSIVISIGTVSINKLLNKNKQASYEAKMEIIIRQAKQYAQENESFLHDSLGRYSNKYVCNVITVEQLLNEGYLDAKDNDLVDSKTNDIIDPRNGTSMKSKNILVYIKSKYSSSAADYEKVGIYVGDIKAKTLTNTADCKITNPADTQSSFTTSTTNAEQIYTVPQTGVYRLEVWGGQGGGKNSTIGGYGGYAVGEIKLTVNQKLYINVGSKGEAYTSGYNGGGAGNDSGGYFGYHGGGATSIATKSGLLSTLSSNKSNILIVAGGGGGNGGDLGNYYGGSGGGIYGTAGIYNKIDSSKYVGLGGTQSAAGKTKNSSGSDVTSPNAGFGQGGNHYGSDLHAPGGGGGYYGGGGASGGNAGGGGGSGYIGNSNLKNKYMACYKCQVSNTVSTKTVSVSYASNDPTSGTPKKGNGYAKITYIGETFTDTGDTNVNTVNDSTNTECVIGESYVTLNYTGHIQKCRVSKSGWYSIRAWGAQGGGANNDVGGYGGYSYGRFYLNKDEYIYVGVGGQGSKYSGGYNGGGDGGSVNGSWGYGGGGASHVARRNGPIGFSALYNNPSDMIIVAGGGGGNGGSGATAAGGSGGGYQGKPGVYTGVTPNVSTKYVGLGGNQTTYGKTYKDDSGTIVNTTRANNTQGGKYYEGGSYGGAGGGGGWYGGGGSSSGNAGGGGGSGYIGNTGLQNAYMYCYNCDESSTAGIKTTSTTNVSDTPKAQYAKKGDGAVQINLDSDGTCVINGSKVTFNANGNYQVCRVEKPGIYRLDVWGAQGGARDSNAINYGGFATGEVYLDKNESLYVFVGEQGKKVAGGFGGGGAGGHIENDTVSNQWGYGGGGATYILSGNSNQLHTLAPTTKSILIVAGGGGGTGGNSGNSLQVPAGGAGGGYKGNNGINTYNGNASNANYGTGGTQTEAGATANVSLAESQGKFGFGGKYGYGDANVGGSGGGGGFYGGGGSTRGYAGGGGGSGYIGSSRLSNKYMYCYSCSTSSAENTKTYSTINASLNATRNAVKIGDGYASITPISTYTETSFDYTGSEQVYTAAKDGRYKLEVWGAQGSSLNTASGYGGYSVGVVTLSKNDKLYVNVGGSPLDWETGGYNGGGGGSTYGSTAQYPIYHASGGGATSIAKKSGLLKNLSSNKSSILIVAGGGGGSASYDGRKLRGGDGGGYIGVGPKYTAFRLDEIYTSNETGGTQTASYGGGKDSMVEIRNFWAFAGCESYPAESVIYAQGTDPVGAGSFGQGGIGSGGGYYGGTKYSSCNIVYSGSGGSGYIGNSLLTDKHMYCYNCQESSSANTKTIKGTCHDTSPKADCAKQSSGYARISYLGAA